MMNILSYEVSTKRGQSQYGRSDDKVPASKITIGPAPTRACVPGARSSGQAPRKIRPHSPRLAPHMSTAPCRASAKNTRPIVLTQAAATAGALGRLNRATRKRTDVGIREEVTLSRHARGRLSEPEQGARVELNHRYIMAIGWEPARYSEGDR